MDNKSRKYLLMQSAKQKHLQSSLHKIPSLPPRCNPYSCVALTNVSLSAVDARHISVQQLHALAPVGTRARLAVLGSAAQRVAIVTGRAPLAVVAHRVVTADALACGNERGIELRVKGHVMNGKGVQRINLY